LTDRNRGDGLGNLLGEREGGGFGHFERRRGEVVHRDRVVARRGETRE